MELKTLEEELFRNLSFSLTHYRAFINTKFHTESPVELNDRFCNVTNKYKKSAKIYKQTNTF